MKERLVADWLTKTGERGGIDVAFCQLLLARGCQILQARHSPTENGKDIIAMDPQKGLCAYQLKSGDIGLTEFERIQPQVTALVESAILNPSVRAGAQHHPYLVTTGKVTESVESRVQALNVSWRRRRFRPLAVIRGSELQPQFIKLSADFWPEEPPDVSNFMKLYLAEGRGDFDHKAFAGFFQRLFPKGDLPKSVVSRRIAAAGLFASYLLEPFNRHKDHWSAFCGWTIAAAHQAWAAEIYKLPTKSWVDSFQLMKEAAFASLDQLVTEILEPRALSPREPEIDDYTRMRNTIAASAVATYHLVRYRAGDLPSSMDKAISLVRRLVRDGRLCFWGESALPSHLAVSWFLEHTGESLLAEANMISILGVLTKHNHAMSDHPLDGPERLGDEILSSQLKEDSKRNRHHGRKAPASWGLESLVHLLARRMRRQTLKSRWWDITHVDLASFRPERVTDMLLWYTEAGEEMHRLAGKPQSWATLTKDAKTNDLNQLPESLQNDPDFALAFMLVYPHRASTSLVKALDKWFE